MPEREKEKRGDVFKPPYNANLYVGELQDEEKGTEYVVLVSGLTSFCNNITVNKPTLHGARIFCSLTSTLSSRNIFSWSPKVRSVLMQKYGELSFDVLIYFLA